MDLLHYRRFLPHHLPPGHAFFITFRLAGSLPKEVLLCLQEEKALLEREAAQRRAAGQPDDAYHRQRQWFGHFDTCLDTTRSGPAYLNQTAFAAILVQAFSFYQQRQAADVLAYCIMPNHVHLVLGLPEQAPPLTRTLQGLKSFPSRQSNLLRGTTGQAVWHPESYDHRVRNQQELGRIINYVVNNPVKAGLVV
jgi:putative transposase